MEYYSKVAMRRRDRERDVHSKTAYGAYVSDLPFASDARARAVIAMHGPAASAKLNRPAWRLRPELIVARPWRFLQRLLRMAGGCNCHRGN